MGLPIWSLCCQLVTHSHRASRDRRVLQGPQAITRQEETTILLAKGQNVPQKAKGGIGGSWRGLERGKRALPLTTNLRRRRAPSTSSVTDVSARALLDEPPSTRGALLTPDKFLGRVASILYPSLHSGLSFPE